MKILVLGSEGQIGKPTCKYLREMGHEVIEHDKKLPCPWFQDIAVNWWDISKFTNRLDASIKECDFVYFFAANVGGAKYLEKYQDSYEFIDENMRIMVNTFYLLKRYKKPFIFTSSQMSELGHSSYGILKKLGEHMTNDIGGLVVRLWNVYGPEYDDEKSHVITDFCKMAKHYSIIKMRTDGQESRQLLYVKDCAECFLTLTENYDILDKTKNYHITNFEWVSILDVAKTIQEISGCEIIPGDRKDLTQMNAMNEPDPYILNFWKPRTSLKEGITQIYNETH